MAIVRMKKMRVVGLSNEKEIVLDAIDKLGCVQLKSCDDIKNTHTRLNTTRLNDVNTKIAKLSLAIDVLNNAKIEREKLAKSKIVQYESPKKPFFAYRTEISFEDFILSNKNEQKVFDSIDELDKLSYRLAEVNSRITALGNQVAALNPYKNLDVALDDIKDSEYVNMMIGSIASSSKSVIEKLLDIKYVKVIVVDENGSNMTLFIACHKDSMQEVNLLLSEAGFIRTNLECNEIPIKRINELKDEIEDLKSEIISINGEMIEYYCHLSDYQLLYDYFSYQKEKIEAQGEFRRTEGELAVEFEAWVPKDKCEFVQDTIEKATNHVYIEFLDPRDDELPPTLTNNKTVIKAFESITNMYSTPNYRESDPGFSVFFFYFLFFGFMLSDAGYGIILALGGFLLLKYMKMEDGLKNLVWVIALGGVSTIVWGALFGGWFSIEIKGTFLEKLCWFSPLDEPLMVLGLSLALGVFQIMWGIVLSGIEMIKNGKVFDAICDAGSWLVLFLGAILYVLSMLGDAFAPLANVGMIVAIVGVAMLVLTQGRTQKNIIMKVVKGVGSLYGLVNYVSDILSYARLFGLGLATGVVGMVFNRIAGVFIDILPAGLGLVVGIIFVLLGHTINIGINTLGAYVHDCRLQYIEFFGKFYQGSGQIFVPMGRKTKYVQIK